MVTEVKRYKTDDGREFSDYDDAFKWEMRCKLVDRARDKDIEEIVDYLLARDLLVLSNVRDLK